MYNINMQESDKDIFLLVDGSAIVHRAYHAMPFFSKKDGASTGAIYGFFSMLLKVIQHLNPKYIVVAFDRPKPTFRQQMYVGYQAQRPKMESDLSDQFRKIIEILQKARISTYAVDGYEADDIIGTVSEDANRRGILTYIVTGDRDMLQLVDEDTRVFMPIKGISEVSIMDADKVREKYGITPEQFIDLKALQGDASDNYPGVAGIGPKTAANLINEFGSVENIYKNIDNIALKNKKLADKLVDGHEACMMAQKLATIIKDVPFAYDFDATKIEKIELDEFRNALVREEFHTLPKRLDEIFGKDGKVTDNKKGQMKLL